MIFHGDVGECRSRREKSWRRRLERKSVKLNVVGEDSIGGTDVVRHGSRLNIDILAVSMSFSVWRVCVASIVFIIYV